MAPLILVVDDQPENFNILEILLYQENYQLAFLDSGRALLSYLKDCQPDLILLDIMMPDLDGLAICRILKSNSQWQHIPIIALTALSSRKDLEACLAAGADDFISKPTDSVELRARIRSMLRIKQQYDRLQNLIDLQDDLTHMIVHDLRSPLTSMTMSQELLLRLCPEEAQRKQVQRISSSIQRLHCMVDSVLMLSKLRSERMTLQLQPVDVARLAQEALDDFRLLAQQRSLTLRTEFPATAHTVLLDALLIRRVMDNLLSNALKFSPPGGEISVEVAYPTPQTVHIRVRDQGPGVSDQLKERLFQKFATDLNLQGVKQTGLGLAFCKLAVEAHGGVITVMNNRPQGSIFSLELGRISPNLTPAQPTYA